MLILGNQLPYFEEAQPAMKMQLNGEELRHPAHSPGGAASQTASTTLPALWVDPFQSGSSSLQLRQLNWHYVE